MVHQFYSNMTGDYQPKKTKHLNFLVPDWLFASSILEIELWKSEYISKKEKYMNLEEFFCHSHSILLL